MINVLRKDDLACIDFLPKEVVEVLLDTIDVLDEAYGATRSLNDDGGYICIVETLEEVFKLKEETLKGLVYEFSDLLHQDEKSTYHSTLYMLSSDYSLVVVTTNELTEHLVTL